MRIWHQRSAIASCMVKVFDWDQTLEEVNMYIPLPTNAPPKIFYCKIQSKHVEVGIKGNPPYLNHDLACPVKTDSSFWTLEDGTMHITLQKRDKRQTWSSPISGQGQLDPYATDLEQRRLMLQRFQEEDMDSSQQPKVKNPQWTKEMDTTLVHALLYQAAEGNRIPNGFKDIAYTYAQRKVNGCCRLQLTQMQIRNRVKTMKANYRLLTKLLNTSGFGWDNEAKKIAVTAEVGNAYILAHPETKRFFTARHDLYDEMHEIFGEDYTSSSFRKNNWAQGSPDQEQTYSPCMPCNETDGIPETASQNDFMTQGFSNTEAPQASPPQTSSLEVPHPTSPLAEGRRVDRSYAPTTSPLEMGSRGEASRAGGSVRRRKRSNSELTDTMKEVATSIAKMASAIDRASGGGCALCDEIMAALKEIDGLESSDLSDIYEHLSTHPVEGRSFLSRGKDLRLLYVTRFFERRS
ncbi:HSP20-like chaperones superfamily protein isoform X2 [Tasmannia lanceolata]|uniref:HSP20-like chaperones superfamily protein isoform X2 n=1 Tax=Tasmannia lanceolata TaxID=3420 RepID=UPI004064C1EE